jgi:uncharacterized OB-fold protein
LTATTEFFWRSGADGRLRILRCNPCGFWIHPPGPRCPRCLERDVEPREAGGGGTVVSCTVNRQPWLPDFDPPYSIALVELEEQPGLRLLTNIVGVEPESVHIGMKVLATFEEQDGIWYPLFEPRALDDVS